jgi:peptide/nickel transport system ATP-binding protein
MSSLNITKLHICNNQKDLVDISFTINRSTALVGQSGSGKSLTLKSILNLLPSNLEKTFEYKCDFELNSSTIGFVPQNPFTSLCPLTKISKQFFCTKEKKLKMLNLVGLEDWVLNRFPSQLSGGQLQRVVLAIALSDSTKILLLDEPTTALDSHSKEIILSLLKDIQKEFNLLILFVSHDLDSIEDICEDIIIIKDGKIVESGDTIEILNNPQQKYTKQLIDASFKHKEFRK